MTADLDHDDGEALLRARGAPWVWNYFGTKQIKKRRGKNPSVRTFVGILASSYSCRSLPKLFFCPVICATFH